MQRTAKKFKTIFIAGCGDIGQRVARQWRLRGLPVRALARSQASAERLRAHGIEPVSGDLDLPESLGNFALNGEAIYYFAPPAEDGEVDLRVTTFVAALEKQALPEMIVYISTSGVYGDRHGAWVDEETSPHPQTARARRRLYVENTLRQWGKDHGVPVVILRVGGIYGPGRLPIERLRKGLPVLREAECGYTNRIHADDLARICVAAAEYGGADRIYNVSDGQNGTMTQYFKAVAARLGLPQPREISLGEAQQQLSPAMLSYLVESRRMRNTRMLAELAITLDYPDLASGLAALDPQRELAAAAQLVT
ncbi:MAG TPA: SDR family oxidoreductase [Gammaproteobacteria bacterium]